MTRTHAISPISLSPSATYLSHTQLRYVGQCSIIIIFIIIIIIIIIVIFIVIIISSLSHIPTIIQNHWLYHIFYISAFNCLFLSKVIHRQIFYFLLDFTRVLDDGLYLDAQWTMTGVSHNPSAIYT